MTIYLSAAILVLGIASIYLALKSRVLKIQRDYLNVAAVQEQNRAKIALELLYEGVAKHQNLSWEDTLQITESIRKEENAVARKILAEKIVPQCESKHLGF